MIFDRYPCLREVVVNTKADGPVFRGVLWRRRGGYLVLRNARLLRPRAEPTALDGEVLIPANEVLFIQVVG